MARGETRGLVMEDKIILNLNAAQNFYMFVMDVVETKSALAFFLGGGREGSCIEMIFKY